MSKCWCCNQEILTGNNQEHIGICDKCYNDLFIKGNDFIGKLVNKIADLEEKLEEYKGRYLTTESYNTFMANEIHKVVKENTELKQQLAEKEKEIEKWKTKWCESEKNFLRLYEQNQNKDQDKISFAVAYLEIIKAFIIDKEFYFVGEDYSTVYVEDVTEEIDNKIKQLKEGK